MMSKAILLISSPATSAAGHGEYDEGDEDEVSRIDFDKPLTSSFLPVWRSGARHRPGGGDLGQGEVWSVLVFHGEGIQNISNIHSIMGHLHG